jgi:hypothetical protein
MFGLRALEKMVFSYLKENNELFSRRINSVKGATKAPFRFYGQRNLDFILIDYLFMLICLGLIKFIDSPNVYCNCGLANDL